MMEFRELQETLVEMVHLVNRVQKVVLEGLGTEVMQENLGKMDNREPLENLEKTEFLGFLEKTVSSLF